MPKILALAAVLAVVVFTFLNVAQPALAQSARFVQARFTAASTLVFREERPALKFELASLGPSKGPADLQTLKRASRKGSYGAVIEMVWVDGGALVVSSANTATLDSDHGGKANYRVRIMKGGERIGPLKVARYGYQQKIVVPAAILASLGPGEYTLIVEIALLGLNPSVWDPKDALDSRLVTIKIK